MRSYTEATDGSSIEVKESALVWHHQDADPDFGSCQAKELLDHLENVLANEPAVVKRGQHIVEVKPQVQGLLSSLQHREKRKKKRHTHTCIHMHDLSLLHKQNHICLFWRKFLSY